MARYRRKPVEIDAYKNDGTDATLQWFLSTLPRMYENPPTRSPVIVNPKDGSLIIRDNDGFTAPVQVGWYLTFDGERFSPCRPEFFESTYEPVKEGND